MVNVQSSGVRLTKNSLWRAKHYGALVLLKGRFRTSSGVHLGINRPRKVFSTHGIHGWRVDRGVGGESARASVPRGEQPPRRAPAVQEVSAPGFWRQAAFSRDASGTVCWDPNQTGVRSKLAILLIAAAASVAAVILCLRPSKQAVLSVSAPYAVTKGAPPFSRIRATFTVTNTAPRGEYVSVSAIEQLTPSGWVADRETLPIGGSVPLGVVRANSTATFSADFQNAPYSTRFRLAVLVEASFIQKSLFSVRRLWDRILGQPNPKLPVWVQDLYSSGYKVASPEIQLGRDPGSEKH